MCIRDRPQAAWFAEVFDVRVRYSGASLGYQIGSVLSGGFAPLVAAALLVAGGGRPWWIVVAFAGLSVLTTAAALLAPDPARRESGAGASAPEPGVVSEGASPR